jgi:hypothetical protein
LQGVSRFLQQPPGALAKETAGLVPAVSFFDAVN